METTEALQVLIDKINLVKDDDVRIDIKVALAGLITAQALEQVNKIIHA